MTEQPGTAAHASAAPVLSLVIPAYNEASRIESTMRGAVATFQALNIPGEIVIVDDGSTDQTRSIVSAFMEPAAPTIRLISLSHRGKAATVLHGMSAALGDFILFSDADLATPLRYIPEFVERAKNGAEVVIASREGLTANRIGEPTYRHFMGRMFNQLVQLLLLPGIEDTQCGFKLFTRDAARAIVDRTLLYKKSDKTVAGARVTAFDVELLVIARRLGFTIEVIPVEWTYGSQSKVNPLTDSLFNLRDVLLVKWNNLRGRYNPGSN